MIEMSAEIGKLAAALHVAQGVMTGVSRDAKNPAFKSKYATLENVIDTARPALQKAGLAWVQAPGAVTENGLAVTTMLMHGESGQWIRSTLQVPLMKRDAQAVGSATTYGLRYSLMAMLGLPPSDDDGNDGSEKVDWKAESRDLAKLANDQQTIDELSALWSTPRVQGFLKQAPADLVEALKGTFGSRKIQLTPKKEAA
jgi:hypothetical protein